MLPAACTQLRGESHKEASPSADSTIPTVIQNAKGKTCINRWTPPSFLRTADPSQKQSFAARHQPLCGKSFTRDTRYPHPNLPSDTSPNPKSIADLYTSAPYCLGHSKILFRETMYLHSRNKVPIGRGESILQDTNSRHAYLMSPKHYSYLDCFTIMMSEEDCFLCRRLSQC